MTVNRRLPTAAAAAVAAAASLAAASPAAAVAAAAAAALAAAAAAAVADSGVSLASAWRQLGVSSGSQIPPTPHAYENICFAYKGEVS